MAQTRNLCFSGEAGLSAVPARLSRGGPSGSSRRQPGFLRRRGLGWTLGPLCMHGPVTLRTSGARGLLHALVPGAQRVRVAALETLETGAQICTCPSATCQESRDGQRLHFWTSGAVRGPCSSQVCRGCPKRGKRASRRARRTAGLRSAFSPGPGHGAQ